MEGESSLVPRPFPAPVFDHFQYAKTEGESLLNLTTRSVAHMTSQVLDTKTYSHLYLPDKLEKPDKFQPKDKSCIPESEAKPLKYGSAASVPNPKVAVFSLR